MNKRKMSGINIAVVSLSNINRSMEAHALLIQKGFNVKSYGTGNKVLLPGSSPNQLNYYEFGVPYKDIYNDLLKKDKEFYTRSGLLQMLERNRRLKLCPEKFQRSTEIFDVIITCEERVYDEVIEWLSSTKPVLNQRAHIININIENSQEEATVGAYLISDLVMKMSQIGDLDNNINKLLLNFEASCHRPIFNCVLCY